MGNAASSGMGFAVARTGFVRAYPSRVGTRRVVIELKR
jgi:hypothetical protein